jgi:hypothetical protein
MSLAIFDLFIGGRPADFAGLIFQRVFGNRPVAPNLDGPDATLLAEAAHPNCAIVELGGSFGNSEKFHFQASPSKTSYVSG